MPNRRSFMTAGAAFVAAAASPPSVFAGSRASPAAAPPAASPAGRASRIIEEFDAQGIHRSGTAVDAASARWLADHLRALGVEVQLEPFALDRFDPGDSWLEIDGRRLGGVPLFDGGSTDGLGGRLGPLGGDNEIALIEVATHAAGERPALLDAARRSRHAAVVVVTRGLRPGLSLINAASFLNPSATPLLQVSSVEADWLRAHAERRSQARLAVPATRSPVSAYNVVGLVRGDDRAAAPLGIITPRSGWWTCASERGGGIVAWLECARALVAARPRRDVHFVASSGHELGQLGIDAFLAPRPGIARQALAWIHFGANIGAAGQANRVQAGDDEILALARDALAAEGLAIDQLVPPGKAPAGEAHTIYRNQGRYLSLLGDNPLFHQPADRWPEAVDAQRVARHAAAFARLAVDLANSKG